MHVRFWGKFLRFCLSCVALASIVGVSRAQIPPVPAEREFLHDYAKAIQPQDREKILGLQQKAFSESQVPLVVVTVRRMADFDAEAPSIEIFARRWFDTWGIGTKEKNDGILIIISTGDRKGRIELGAHWGHRFDEYSQRVMDNDMIPRFKQNDYSGGLVAAVESLAAMALSGPQAEPPAPSIVEQIRNHPAAKLINKNNPIREKLGANVLSLMIFVGLGCFIAAYFLPGHRKTLLIAGGVLIVLAVAFWVVILVLMIMDLGNRGGDGFGSGGFGGGFGGGSSGGGGASGSW